MSAVVGSRPSIARSSKWLLWTALLAGVAAISALAAVFAWPATDSTGATFDLGSADGYAVGSVTEHADGKFYLVRLEEEAFIALSWRDPHRGCTTAWRPDFSFRDPATGVSERGWFRTPCHGETYDITGRRVSGPSPRDLDRFELSVDGGRVIVNSGRYVCGYAPPNAPCVEPSQP